MRIQRIILTAIVLILAAVVTGQTLSWAHASNPRSTPLVPLDSKRPNLRGLDDTEAAKAIEKWQADRQQQEKEIDREHINRMATEAWKRLLRVSEQQWAMMEPKINEVSVVSWPIRARRFASRDDAGGLRWKRFALDEGSTTAKPPQIAECCRVIDELIDTLENPNSTDEQIRKKIDALQQVRDNSRKELAKVGKELAAVPMTPRQEAIFLILTYID